MNSSLAKQLYKIGAAARNPSLHSQYQQLKNSEHLPRQNLEQLQLERMQKFLMFAQDHSPYYSELFRKQAFDAARFSSPTELDKLPETSKSTLIANNAAIHSRYNFKRTKVAETSGTTGESLSFRRNEEWDSLNRATQLRNYDWYQVKPWDRNGYLWGYNIAKSHKNKTKLLDALQNRFRIFNYEAKEIESFASRLTSASFLSGYSSMIYEVAKMIIDLGLDRPNLKMVKGTSEMILDAYRPVTEDAFGTRIIGEYGAAEAGLIAFECPDGSMHINIENLYLETNQAGEALVTNFASESFPIIRYNLGDCITLDSSTCSCGRGHPLIKDLIGRKGKSIIGKNKKYPALTFYYVFKNIALEHQILLNYKAQQDEPGKIELLIEAAVDEKKCNRLIEKELNKYFAGDVDITISHRKSFDITNKKSQYFETSL